MTIKLSAILSRGQARTLDAKAGDSLRVVQGRLWLTQSGSDVDHFLTAGEALCLGPGKTVIEGDSPESASFELRSTRVSGQFRDNPAHELLEKSCGI